MIRKKPARKTSKKVPKVEPEVKVIHLHCPNCGEEDEKVVYCSQCDSPMDVVKVETRGEDEVVVDTSVSKDEAGEEPEDELIAASTHGATADPLVDPDVDQIVEGGGFNLGNIYSDGDETGISHDAGDDETTIDEVMDSLDRE
jgi:hypothetical protein